MKQKQLLNKPNELISLISEKKISIVQKKIYNIFLKNAQNIVKFDEKYNEINENLIYNFSIPCSIAHNSANIGIKDFEYIEKELEELMKILVNVVDKENKNNWDKFHLISRIKKKENNYEYFLIGNIVKALKEQTFFTTLDLVITNSLTSHYSIIFYELAIRYKKVKIPKMTIKEIREITNTQENYKAIKDFKKYVLDTACKEINEKTDISLFYETSKIGRNIAFIDFFIEQKKEYEFNFFKNQKIIEESIELMKLFNLCKVQTKNIKELIDESLKKYDEEFIKSNIIYSNKYSNENYTLYLKKAIKNDYAGEEREKQKIKMEKFFIQKEKEEEEKRKKEEKLKQENEEAKEILKSFSQEKLNRLKDLYNSNSFFSKKSSFETFCIEVIKTQNNEESKKSKK